MGFWRNFIDRLFRPAPPAPDWATFLSPRQFRTFRGLVEHRFAVRSHQCVWGDGVLTLDPRQNDGLSHVGLANLAQLCAHAPETEWSNLIEEHFRILSRSQSEQRRLDQIIRDFDKVSEILSVRIWPEDCLGSRDERRMIWRKDLPGTVTALVYDLPSSVRNVRPEEAKVWRKSENELFDLALENVRETCIPDLTDQELGDGMQATLFADESFFVASHALLLDDRPEVLGRFGALVAVPHRHVMLTFAIDDPKVIQAIPRIIPIVVALEKQGPGSISPRLYWYQNGEYYDLPFRLENRNLHFYPPEEFVEVLNLLSDDDDED